VLANDSELGADVKLADDVLVLLHFFFSARVDHLAEWDSASWLTVARYAGGCGVGGGGWASSGVAGFEWVLWNYGPPRLP
jgi:hypothetical protein